MNILEAIKNFILRRKIIKKETDVYEVPKYDELKQYAKFIEQKVLQENAALKAELLKANSQLQDKHKDAAQKKKRSASKIMLSNSISNKKSFRKQKL